MLDTCLMFKINVYIYIYSESKIKNFLRNNTALNYFQVYLYIYSFIKSIKLQSINKKGFH